MRVPALDVEEAVLDALHKLTATVDPKRWLSLLGPRPHVADKLIGFAAIAARDLSARTDALGDNVPAVRGNQHAWVGNDRAPLHCIPISKDAYVISNGIRSTSRDGFGVRTPSANRGCRRARRYPRRFDRDRAHTRRC